ncbi:MAG: hypothetical protein F6K35_24555, partial [Okeania sp. SIO2H7]|nr:hypothetical protein [Okeania sp. SIO2H7]
MLSVNQLQQKAMVQPVDDIFVQASLGSVAAIIQVLNERLADCGVRTRAVFVDGLLNLLCEAPTPEQLEQSALVDRVRQILQEISPRNINRVRINSRIVREQQLLWLEEVNRDRKNQLLWSEDITLTKPNFFQDKIANRLSGQFILGAIAGISLTLLTLALSGLISNLLNLQAPDRLQASINETSPEPSPVDTRTPKSPLAKSKEAFAKAVRLAQDANAAGKIARSR